MLSTRFTRLFNLEYPVISAPMGHGYSAGRLAAAVTEAGALGLFGGIHRAGPDWVREQIHFVRSRTDGLFGVGFITWWVPQFVDNFRVCLEERVPVIAFSFGDPTPYVEQAKEAGARVLCQVQSQEGARQAIGAGADVLVAQGNEAGGHTGELGMLPCLSLVLQEAGDTPVIAAGGIGDGRSLASVLAAGAEGAWVGTALLATDEAEVPDSYKEVIVASNGQDTVFTHLYDTVFDLRFPAGIGARVAANRFTAEWDGREGELRERRDDVVPTLTVDFQRGHDPEVQPTWMGESAGAVSSVRPVAEVVRSLCDDAEHLLRQRVSTLLGQ